MTKARRGRPPKYDFGRLLKRNCRSLTVGPFITERDLLNAQNAAWQFADRHGVEFGTHRVLDESGERMNLVIKRTRRGA